MNKVESRVLIFHGTGGHPQENWFPWMSEKLEEKGVEVIIPKFPTPEGQSLESWLNVLDQYKELIDEKSILIGHSLGGLFLLRVLERLEKPVKAAFFVAAPIGVRPIKFYESDEKFSPGFLFNWDKIESNAQQFMVFHSGNDPYVSLGNGKELSERLGVSLTFIPNAGHFNAVAGYTQFEKLLDEISRVVLI